MKFSFWEQLSIRIIVLFVVAMLVSYVPQLMPGFLGDWQCNDTSFHMGDHYNSPHWHWGWRHWLWMFMCLCLFITQSVRIIIFISKKRNTSEYHS